MKPDFLNSIAQRSSVSVRRLYQRELQTVCCVCDCQGPIMLEPGASHHDIMDFGTES